jgi:hypothetical protein
MSAGKVMSTGSRVSEEMLFEDGVGDLFVDPG